MLAGTFKVKAGLAQMAKGGIIMDVTTPEEARVAEEAGVMLSGLFHTRLCSHPASSGGISSAPSIFWGISFAPSIFWGISFAPRIFLGISSVVTPHLLGHFLCSHPAFSGAFPL